MRFGEGGVLLLDSLGIKTARVLPAYSALLAQVQRRMQGFSCSLLLHSDCPECSKTTGQSFAPSHCPLCAAAAAAATARATATGGASSAPPVVNTLSGHVPPSHTHAHNIHTSTYTVSDISSEHTESGDDNDADPGQAVNELLDMCLSSPNSACKLFWLLQTTIIPLPSQSSPQTKKTADAISPRNALSAAVWSARLPGGPSGGGSVGSGSSALSDRSSALVTTASGPVAEGVPSSRRGSHSSQRADELLQQRRSAESLLLLKQFMAALHCQAIASYSNDKAEGAGNRSSAEESRHQPRLIYTKTHTFRALPPSLATKSRRGKFRGLPQASNKIVDILHKQTRLLTMIRRCVNLVKSPNNIAVPTVGSSDSLTILAAEVEDKSAANSTGGGYAEPQADSGLFTNPTTRRNAVLSKAIRLAVMADARMHSTPLFPLHSPLSDSTLLHGIKITEVTGHMCEMILIV
jgi:hypothetical protein